MGLHLLSHPRVSRCRCLLAHGIQSRLLRAAQHSGRWVTQKCLPPAACFKHGDFHLSVCMVALLPRFSFSFFLLQGLSAWQTEYVCIWVPKQSMCSVKETFPSCVYPNCGHGRVGDKPDRDLWPLPTEQAVEDSDTLAGRQWVNGSGMLPTF